MSATLPDSAVDLAREWVSGLAAALASMTLAERAPAVKYEGQSAIGDLNGPEWFRFDLDGAPGGTLFAGATAADWRRLGRIVLEAAGLMDANDEDVRSTVAEILAQAGTALAQTLARRLGLPVSAGPPQPAARADLPLDAASRFTLEAGERALSLAVMASAAASAAWAPPIARAPSVPMLAAESRTADLLLEVEMPVSVSFGRAQLPLRDILKLNSGSIVELNRTIAEPVEVIVNNCVIARGEVVVVDGNYGVRIQHVISKEERLRTLS